MNRADTGETMLTDMGLLLLRVCVGGALMTHGYPKLFGGPGKQPPETVTKIVGRNFPATFEKGGPEALRAGLERMGVPLPQQAALAAGLAEFGGGLAIALGARTRLVTPIVLFNMLVAIRKAHWKAGFHGQGGYEMAYLFAAAVATLALTGPGAYSLDQLTRRASAPQDA